MKKSIHEGGDYAPVHKERNVYTIHLTVPGKKTADYHDIHSEDGDDINKDDFAEMDIGGLRDLSFQRRPQVV